MGLKQALIATTQPRRALLTIGHGTWIQTVLPLLADLSIMFPAIYGPCLTEAWLGLPFSWGPAKVYCSMATSETPAPTFWIAVTLPELPIYGAMSSTLPPSLTLALPQLLWIPLLNVDFYEWWDVIAVTIDTHIPWEPVETLTTWAAMEQIEPFYYVLNDIFRCLSDSVFFLSLLYTATIGRIMAIFASSLAAVTGLVGDLWLDFGHACLQFDSALLTSGLTKQSPSMIVM